MTGTTGTTGANTKPRRRQRARAISLVLLGAAAGAVWPGSGGATALPVEEDKAAFLAATGATSATGPLPDIGGSAPSTGPITVGSLTFGLALGGNSITIGASETGVEGGDWYPGTPGNDLALGFENLEVRTAAPVYALGFDIVEPNATMPSWGATPSNSPFTLTLFAGAEKVRQVVFDAPDDVVAFQGIWSDVAFDRAWIIDSTGNVDDEYFGEFYTGTIPAPPTSTTTVARSGGTVPGGGVFTTFPASPTGAGGAAAFVATGSLHTVGVYVGDVSKPDGPPIRVGDLTTEIPDGAGTFTGFRDLALAVDALKPDGPPIRVGFLGTGAEQQGVYVSEVDDASIPGNPVRVADLTTPIPDGAGTFTGFTALSASGGHVAFLGHGVGGQQGIYLASTLNKVIAVGDTLDGKSVTSLAMGPGALHGRSVAFLAGFADGSSRVVVSQVETYPFTGFLAPVDNPPLVNDVRAGRAVPVKFSLNGDRGLAVLAPGSPGSQQVTCDGGAPVDLVEETVSPGSTTLSYDAARDTYTYVWETNRAWANTCRRLSLQLRDGTRHDAEFRFR